MCHLGGHSVGTSCYGHVQGCTPTCPCMLWMCTALNTRQNERTCVLALFSLSLSLSPSLVPDIERKKFLLPQRSPCAVPFFFPPPFLNVCWKSAGFIHSKSVCSPGKKTNKKGCTAAKGGTAVPSRTTSPLQMPLVCWGELQI